jgi:hypothetical protein
MTTKPVLDPKPDSSDPDAAARGTSDGLAALVASLAAGAPPCVAVAPNIKGTTIARSSTVLVDVYPATKDLSWSHFLSPLSSLKPPYLAESVTNITPTWSIHRRRGGGAKLLNIRVVVSPDSKESWAVANHVAAATAAAVGHLGLTGDWLLEHERLHYRAAVQIARDLAREIQTLPSFTAQTVTPGEISDLRDAAQSELNSINHQYDEDTNHGLYAGQQVIWEDKVVRWECANRVTWP